MSDKTPKTEEKVQGNTQQKQKKETVIYLGISMMERGLDGQTTFAIKNGTIYNNGLPEDIEKRYKEDKNFAKLFVKVEDAARAMKELSTEDSNLYNCVQKQRKEYLSRNWRRK